LLLAVAVDRPFGAVATKGKEADKPAFCSSGYRWRSIHSNSRRAFCCIAAYVAEPVVRNRRFQQNRNCTFAAAWPYKQGAGQTYLSPQACDPSCTCEGIRISGSKLMGWMAPASTGVAMRHNAGV